MFVLIHHRPQHANNLFVNASLSEQEYETEEEAVVSFMNTTVGQKVICTKAYLSRQQAIKEIFDDSSLNTFSVINEGKPSANGFTGYENVTAPRS